MSKKSKKKNRIVLVFPLNVKMTTSDSPLNDSKPNSNSENKRLFNEVIKTNAEKLKYSQGMFDKAIIYLSGSFLVVGLPLINSFIIFNSSGLSFLLIVATLAAYISIISVVISFFLSTKNIEDHYQYYKEKYLANSKTAVKPSDTWIKLLNWVSLITFVLAAIAIAIFIIYNLLNKPDQIANFVSLYERFI